MIGHRAICRTRHAANHIWKATPSEIIDIAKFITYLKGARALFCSQETPVPFDPDLPSNRLVYAIRGRRDLYEDFPKKLEAAAVEYGLSAEETAAWRDVNVKRLGELGVHPYFLPQITRIMHGSRKNDSQSAAARAYKRSMIDGANAS
jgi:DNA-binding SARP family transcriptional activator